MPRARPSTSSSSADRPSTPPRRAAPFGQAAAAWDAPSKDLGRKEALAWPVRAAGRVHQAVDYQVTSGATSPSAAVATYPSGPGRGLPNGEYVVDHTFDDGLARPD